MIQRIPLNDGLTTLAKFIFSSSPVSGLAVDWISNTIVFSDAKSGRIQRYHVTNGLVTTIIDGQNNPTRIAIAPDQQHRYDILVILVLKIAFYSINSTVIRLHVIKPFHQFMFSDQL